MSEITIIQLLAAFIGTMGYAITFKLKDKQIFFAGLGSLMTWFIYLMTIKVTDNIFLCTFIASVFCAVYAEIMARIHKSPTTVYLTTGAMALIPGSRLYYAMTGVISGDNLMLVENGRLAGIIAIAISLGFVLIAICTKYIFKMHSYRLSMADEKLKERERKENAYKR